MKVNDKNYELNFDRVSDFLEDVAVRVTHVKSILEVLGNENPQDLQMDCVYDLISIAYDYVYEIECMINDTVKKIDVSVPLTERKRE